MEILKEFILLPSVIVSLLVFLGMLLQKKSLNAIVSGVVKAMIGFQTIEIGGRILADAVEPFGHMFQEAFQVSGVVMNSDAVAGIAVGEYGMQISIIMALGVCMNLLLAKITRFGYVFTTGHHILYMSCILACVVNHFQIGTAEGYIIAVMSFGILSVLAPAILQKYTVKICRSDKVAMGHFGSISYLAAAWLGKMYGSPEKSAEKIRIPGKLSFIRDSSVMIGITMLAMYLIAATAAGKPYVEDTLSGGENYIVYAFSQSLAFTVGFVICITGVRLFISEIVPAIKGIAEKWIPNAKPAVDCPFLFSTSPNAMILGFLFSFFGGMTALVIMWACNLTLILPGIVAHFFCGGTAGIYGNSTGGITGTCLGGFFNGLYMAFLPQIFLPYCGVMQGANVTFADSDFGTAAFVLGKWLHRAGPYGTIVILAGIIIIMTLLPDILEKRDKSVPWFLDEKRNLYK